MPVDAVAAGGGAATTVETGSTFLGIVVDAVGGAMCAASDKGFKTGTVAGGGGINIFCGGGIGTAAFGAVFISGKGSSVRMGVGVGGAGGGTGVVGICISTGCASFLLKPKSFRHQDSFGTTVICEGICTGG